MVKKVTIGRGLLGQAGSHRPVTGAGIAGGRVGASVAARFNPEHSGRIFITTSSQSQTEIDRIKYNLHKNEIS